MRHDEAWAIYRSSLGDGVQLSEADQFMVDEALDLLFRDALLGNEPVMAFNQAMNYYKQGKKQLALKYFSYRYRLNTNIKHSEDSLECVLTIKAGIR